VFDALAETVDQAAAGAVGAGKEAAPGARVDPDAISGGLVDDREEGVQRLAWEMKIAGIQAASGRREFIVGELLGGEHDEQLRVRLADDLEASPFREFTKGVPADGGISGLVIEVDGFGGHNRLRERGVLGRARRRRELELRMDGAGREQQQRHRQKADPGVGLCDHEGELSVHRGTGGFN